MTKKVIRRRIRYEKDGVQMAADVNAVIASNVRRRRTTTSVSSRQRVVSTSARKGQEGTEGR